MDTKNSKKSTISGSQSPRNSPKLIDPESVGEDSVVSIPLEVIPQDMPLPYPIYVRITDRLILFRPLGDKLTPERALSLKKAGVDSVLVPRICWEDYFEFFESNTGAGLTDAESAIIRLRHLLLGYHQYLERRRELEREHIEKFKTLGAKLAATLRDDPNIGAKLLRRYNEKKLYFVNHSVNVAIYSAAVAHKLKLGIQDVKLLTFASLVHNVGNMFVPEEILYKPGRLSAEEWEVMKTHPLKGATLLDRFSIQKEVILTTLQHHERMDGEGYPTKRKGKEIHLFAKIVTIADVFDALTNHSPYQSAGFPHYAVEKMRAMVGKFDNQILNMLEKT